MMKKLTLVLIPDQAKQIKQYSIPSVLLKIGFFLCFAFSMLLGFFVLDYQNLQTMKAQHERLIAENQHLKGETQLLMSHLEEVKNSLRKVQDYTRKLDEIVNYRVKNVGKTTGLGSLGEKEQTKINQDDQSFESQSSIPLGINIDKLILRPAFDSLASIGHRSHQQAIELQQLLATLNQKKSLLSSIPSVLPVKGWITSPFGYRTSPFTGHKSWHKGIDIAAPIGAPILAPADGVVIFAGSKAGFGNFVMIAHYGSGIVTRYGHNSQNLVQAGQKIKKGDQIGSVGTTGRSTGPHLHYEVWVNGRAQNPGRFLKAGQYVLQGV